jgi:hypothetical protein
LCLDFEFGHCDLSILLGELAKSCSHKQYRRHPE